MEQEIEHVRKTIRSTNLMPKAISTLFRILRSCISIKQYNQNQLQNHQNQSSDPEEATKFWKNIWATQTCHNENAEWLRKVKSELNNLDLMDSMDSGIRNCLHFMEGLLLNFRKHEEVVQFQNG